MRKPADGYILRFTYESVRFAKISCEGVVKCYNKVLTKGKEYDNMEKNKNRLVDSLDISADAGI